MVSREASHAGSWYSDHGPTLSRQLQGWIDAVPDRLDQEAEHPVDSIPVPGARIIIAPHAGYAYSGAAAAWAYKCLDVSKVKRVFLLGPSHHAYLPSLALSQCTSYATPLGSLPLDSSTIASLKETGKFETMSLDTDEAEHSMEMHLPYIYHILEGQFGKDVSKFPGLIPILVGNTSEKVEREFGKLLAPYFADEESIVIVSSDFCHWGLRFGYTYYLPHATATSGGKANTTADGYSLSKTSKAPKSQNEEQEIHQSIGVLDRAAMDAVEAGAHEGFWKELKRSGNTVCGRHPIGVVLAAMEVLRANEAGQDGGDQKGKFRFVRYERSSDAKTVKDSSVSYASAFAVL